MDKIKGLEVIKRQMEENIETLKEFHKLQLKYFKEIMSLSGLDEVDMAIEDANEEYEFTTLFKEIMKTEKENFDKLMTLAWNIKLNELEEYTYNI